MPRYPHRVHVETAGAAVPDGDGGFTSGYAPADPAEWDVAITPATARDLERFTGGAVMAQATHVVRGRYHRTLTTQSRLQFANTDAAGVTHAHTLNVVAVVNRDMRQRETEAMCAEVVS